MIRTPRDSSMKASGVKPYSKLVLAILGFPGTRLPGERCTPAGGDTVVASSGTMKKLYPIVSLVNLESLPTHGPSLEGVRLSS